MADEAGLETYDANGNVILRVVDSLTRIIGQFSTGQTNGSFTISNEYGGSEIFLFPKQMAQVTPHYGVTISISGRTVSWTFSSTTPVNLRRGMTYQFGVR